MKQFSAIVLFLLLGFQIGNSQWFNLTLEQMDWAKFPKIHSGVISEFDGKWVLMAGRKTGLHGYQPPSAFPFDGIQDSIYVADPVSKYLRGVPTSFINDLEIRKQLLASNLEYCKQGNYLYIAGGYGFDSDTNDYITFPRLTAVNLPLLIQSMIDSTDINPAFRQIVDDRMAVTGANMKRIGNDFYLVFGHRFDGHYSVNSSTFFTQTYTNAIRKFQISDNDTVFSIVNYSETIDTANFHRRDYNLVEQKFSDGSLGFTAFSGVFQYGVNLPYENCTEIMSSGTTVIPTFQQKLSHYHSAVVPVWGEFFNESSSFFIGGMSRYKDPSCTNTLQEDTLVPFVKTISLVTNNSSNYSETNSCQQLSAFEGSNAEFIAKDSFVVTNSNSIIDGSKMPLFVLTHVGYMVGGIISEEANVFLTNGASDASNKIYKVILYKMMEGVENPIKVPFRSNLYPTPADKIVSLEFDNIPAGNTSVDLYDARGAYLKNCFRGNISDISGTLSLNIEDLKAGYYILKVRNNGYGESHRLVKK